MFYVLGSPPSMGTIKSRNLLSLSHEEHGEEKVLMINIAIVDSFVWSELF
jgi:hypothetical protein